MPNRQQKAEWQPTVTKFERPVMKAQALYVITTPKGHVSDSVSFDMETATQMYVAKWFPDSVKVRPYTLSLIWQDFAEAGYKVHRVDLPENVDGKPVCRT
jgi:hypothetical protein